MKNVRPVSAQIIAKSSRELNVLINISQNIIRTLDYESVLQIISDGMSELLEIESAAIYLIEGDNKLLLGATTPPLDPDMPESLRKASLDDHPYIRKAIVSGQVQLIADTLTAQLTPAEKVVVDIRKLRSLLFFPFIHEEIVLGVLILGTCNKSRTYSDHELSFGQTVANQLAVSIQNTLLHADLKKHKDNLEILVQEKTIKLDTAIEELKATNEDLFAKNEIIENQNSELKATIEHLHETQAQLLHSEKMASLGTLTAGVAHEINNPLNFLMGAYAGLDALFTKDGPCKDPKVSILLGSLKTGIERISNIINSLNQFSRNNSKMDEECAIHAIIENCLVMLGTSIPLTIRVNKQFNVGTAVVVGNVGKMHQVFLNVLTNAIQAIDGSGEIFIITRKETKSLIIEIKDTGKGINNDDIPKITDPFYTTKEPGKGTGLGLSITYNIVREHRGTIEFFSTPGHGTTVKLTLPIN